MPRNKYNADHHRAAFEAYYKRRNFVDASEAAGCNYGTVIRWASVDFQCEAFCPWHDWDKLIRERDSVLSGQIELIEAGNYDPLAHDEAIRSGLSSLRPGVKQTLLGMIRSDVERIAQLEYLWSKYYYDVTGQALTYSAHKEKTLEVEFKKGLRAETAKEGMAILTGLLDQIEKLKVRAGLVDSEGRDKSNNAIIQDENKPPPPMSLSDLRETMSRLENTNPEELAAMTSMLKKEKNS